ncbi:DNA repair protein RecN [Paenibacillus sp. MMS18-CY102]|uniref:DNA repair protein RecN n=1 Tax=Paenibacillus sp. MMS18-CY102 TaxID=2682849 RepID=UPI0013665530|nr:DNA repair protein RecN [Paenibacillus sp. MMS18-CY102]
MLRELSIRNLAVIEEVTVSFHNGFHVLTGETGAGKSILIDALSLVVGGRGHAELVRHGCDRSEIEAVFDMSANHPVWDVLSRNGLSASSEELLVIRRELNAQGKSVSRINGQTVNLSILREAGECLVNIHGQHEHQSLFRTEKHLEWLDAYAGEPLGDRKRTYSSLYKQYESARSALRELEETSRKQMQMLDLYRFQLEEISSAQLQVGEDESLAEEKRKLTYAERLRDNAAEAYDLLYGQQGLDAIGKAVSKLEDICSFDKSAIGPLLEQLQSAFYQAEDAGYSLRDYRDSIEADPERLSWIDDRLNMIHHLKRKYGETTEDILAYYNKIKTECEWLENRDERLQQLREEEQRLYAGAVALAYELTSLRTHAAGRLSTAIESELQQLQMGGTMFRVALEPPRQEEQAEVKLGPHGMDEAVFLLAPNPGEPLKPLAKIASGGEMSRVMLALKSIFAAIDQIPVLIFDEVDTGVSGRAAQSIAEKLSLLSNGCQVFSITHLPQVACMADHHYEIRKSVIENRTRTSVTELALMGRIEELARMLGGVEVTEKTRHHAQEMLDLAHQRKGA